MHRRKGKCTDSREKCTDCIFTTNWDHRRENAHSEENAQIAYLPWIETTDGKENAQTLRKMHRLYIYLELRPQTEGKNAQIAHLPQIETKDWRENAHSEENAQIAYLPQMETTDWKENAQTMRKIHKLYFNCKTKDFGRCKDITKMHRLYFYHKLRPQTVVSIRKNLQSVHFP
jgi:hypothetical protein